MNISNALYLKCTIAFMILLWKLDQTFASKQCPSQELILPCRCLVRGEEYQIWCTHSDLPSVLGGLKSVGEHIEDVIDELILENNYLPSLPSRIFSSLKVLRLMLRLNGLERISNDWLTGLEPVLVEVFLVEPRLRSIPDDSFSKLRALQAITIQTKLLRYLPSFSGLKQLRYIQIESESLLQLSTINFNDNSNLEKIHISSSPALTKLEANTFVNLPKLQLINITNCGIEWVHSRAFARLPALKEISLIGNKIQDGALIGQATRELPHLEIIRLDLNLLGKLVEGSFVDLPKVKEIHLSDNKISEIMFGAFHRLPELKKLNLNKNIIRFIHPESFLRDIQNGLEELFLADNLINHIKELRSILNALPRLLFLDLSYNLLESIPFGGFRGHDTLEQLDLSFNKISLIDKEAFMAMPALRELRLKNNSLSELIDQPSWNLPSLKGLDLSGNSFRKIGPRLLLNLPSLRRLDLSKNELNVIDPDTFLPVPALEHVNISYNRIEMIHPATFRPLLHLYEIDVSHNRLLHFIPGLPRGVEIVYLHQNLIKEIPRLPSPDLDLPALKMLDLSFNRLETLHKKSFSTIPQLKKIYLGSNKLSSLDESAFEDLNRLEILDIKNNRLRSFHNIFKRMKNLKTLTLSNNQLDKLATDLFKETYNLNHLDISQNELEEILPHTFENNLQIQSLDASNNKLVQLPKSLNILVNLRALNLSKNRIKIIERDLLQGLENIRELRFSYNKIHELASETFSNMKSIKSLQIDNNELIYVDQNSFHVLPVLKSIKLNKNRIIEIPNFAFNRLNSLQILELQDNDIRTIAPKAFNLLPQLLMVNLSNNKIINIEDAGLKSVNSIEVLDLSFNKISKLASSVFEKMEWLVELKMNDNNICGMKGVEFNNMPRLRVLNLRNNKIRSFPEQIIQRQRTNMAVLDLEGNNLLCTCDLIWLQLWLQESPQQSPRCSDGTLLIETSFSREECRDKSIPSITSGCETELLAFTGNTNNLQINNHVMPLKNKSKEKLINKNSLSLSPQESEYFYDEYVDYPFNETLVQNNSAEQPTQNEQHIIAGGTPTLYAMPRNKSKTTLSRIPDSPSTSGFSFFGIPLSGINLNKILQAGVKKLANKTNQPTAERKNAIMNQPLLEVSNIYSRNRNTPMKQASYVENQKLYNFRDNYPPSIPQFQSGFTPILPGIGGFKPIPNPNLPVVQSSNITFLQDNRKHLTVPNMTIPSLSPEKPLNRTSLLKKTVENISENFTLQSTQLNLRNKTKDAILVTETPEKKEGPKLIETLTHIKSKISIIEGSEFEKHSNESHGSIQNTKTFLTAERLHHNVSKISSLEDKTTEKHTTTTTDLPISNTKGSLIEGIFDTTTTEVSSEKNPISTTTKQYPQESEKTSKFNKTEVTPLSTFLAPGGENFFKNNVKSTITKVSTPYLEIPEISKPELEVSAPLPHREERNNSFDVELEMITEKNNLDNDWYFENYNKTNIEPFVARISNPSNGVQVIQVSYSIILLSTFLINSYLTF